jgi:bifunctional UDP-N-acetylglucosamine pyrophosphorylase / glucosamine-1-phosphate N-acetyltransferase
LKRIAAVILAAGKGTRMRSDLVKVLHPLLGVPMLYYTVNLALNGIKAERTVVVVGHQADRIQDLFKDYPVQFALQREQLGTGHAVLQALPFLEGFDGTVLILCGDVPLVKVETLHSFIDAFHMNQPVLSVMTVSVEDPAGYGRILHDGEGWVERIVEERDATANERKTREINTGIYCIEAAFLRKRLKEIGRENAQGEYYLTDLVQIAGSKKLKCSAHEVRDPVEVMGINTRVDMATANEVLRQEKMKALMLSGVTVVDPRSTYVDERVEVGRDSILFPNCILRGGTRIGERCVIESNTDLSDTIVGNGVIIRSSSVIEESKIDDQAIIGPFAHLRPLSEIKSKAKIGNFVEVKKSVVGRGTKANHLSYIGDSILGENVNIGAGTIACNYDGYEKHQTIIGDRVFVGSNVELVAPLKVGNDASIGAGSTVTKDVPDGALAISRVKQKNIEGWHARTKARRERLKKGKS